MSSKEEGNEKRRRNVCESFMKVHLSFDESEIISRKRAHFPSERSREKIRKVSMKVRNMDKDG